MPIQVRYPSYVDCVAEALSNANTPLTIEQLLEQVGKRRPLGTGARSAAYRAINKLFQAVQVEHGVFGWLSRILAGNVVRHQLSAEEVRRGYILLDELEHIVFYPEFFQHFRPDNRRITLDLLGGPALPGEAAIERKTWSLHLGPAFSRWIERLGGQSGDDILITVADAFAGHYSLRLQPHEIRDEPAIRRRNLAMAGMAEDLVNEDRRTRPAIPAWELAAKLIGHGVYAATPPVDDMHYVLHEFSALRLIEGMGYQLDHQRPTSTHKRPYDATPYSESGYTESTSDFGEEGEMGTMNQAYGNGPDSNGPDSNEPDHDDESREPNDDAARDGSRNFSDFGDTYHDPFAHEYGRNNLLSDEECETYSQYLELFNESHIADATPLEHEDFHLLEAELEMLVRLEQEFGRLLSSQEQRKLTLADQLFIDPDALADLDWDTSDGEDYDDPPFWQN